MSVGLPGTGVGGLFYLVSALLMPLREAYRVKAGTSTRRSRTVVCRQGLMALGVLGGIWLAGWLIGLMLSHVPAVAAALNAVPGLAGRSGNMLKVASVFLALGTLAAIVGAVEILGAVRRWRSPRTAQPASRNPSHIARPAA
ncbi:MAG TPA: hypothetical protein VJL31_09775 [Gemmatimonadales bacterium]|nr:hypothetical protein [Gemmatimonadales bacterium]